jgi:hypothetical protein
MSIVMLAFLVALVVLTAVGVLDAQCRLEKWSYERHLVD